MAAMSSRALPSPLIVAIETSTELASVAVLAGSRVFARESGGAQTHSATVLPLLQQVLAEAGVTLAQCDALAFGCGPGSFTGVRTACGLVQGLAAGAARKVVPVVTLLAMADAAREAGAGDDVIAVLDARMGEVYWAQYRHDDGWQTVTEPTLSRADEVFAVGQAAVCGNGLLACPDGFGRLAAVPRLPQIVPHAAAIARLAAHSVARGEWLAPQDAQPLYLRNKVALTTRERSAAAGAAAGAAA
jgi:tRNA threonylcarbamoyladenosine biosynthesis protein TsaB